jgi:hypothetical protein
MNLNRHRINTMNKHKTILSLFDHSGAWSKPYKDAGYNVIRADIQDGIDVFEVMEDVIYQVVEGNEEGIKVTVYGILAAPPCTDFAGSGAWKWKDKETQPANYDGSKTIEFENTVEHSIGMVLATLEIVAQLKPEGFYVIENPVVRLNKLVPEVGDPWYFQPSDFGDPYTKKTGLYGKFNKPMKTPVLPLFGSEITNRLSSKQKNARSKTPEGFAQAFFKANQ